MFQHLNRSGYETPGGIKPANLLLILGPVVERLILDTSIEDLKGSIFHASQRSSGENKFCQTNVILFFDGITSFINKNVCVDVMQRVSCKA